MANYCIFCGEEIPDDQATCNTCLAILNSLPPDQQKKMQRVIENEEAMAKLRAAIQELKMQLRIALEPVISTICAFIDTVFAATEEVDDGNEKPTA